MESIPKHHEIIRTFKDFGGMVLGLIVPDEALELPKRGATQYSSLLVESC